MSYYASRRLTRLVIFVLLAGLIIWIHSVTQLHFRVRLTIPRSRQELKARLTHPNIKNRIQWTSANTKRAQQQKSQAKPDDSWDWDTSDGDYDKQFAAVIEEKEES